MMYCIDKYLIIKCTSPALKIIIAFVLYNILDDDVFL